MAMAELMKLRKLGSVKQYEENFNSLFTGLRLPESYGINCFTSGLKDEIQTRVRMFSPQTLYEAYCLALLQEATLAYIARKTTPILERPPSPLRTAQWPPLQQSIVMEPQGHSQKKKEEGPRSEIHSKVATQLESAAHGKKKRQGFSHLQLKCLLNGIRDCVCGVMNSMSLGINVQK